MITKDRPKTTRVCEYNECMLPENNNKYLVQLAILIFSYIILIRDFERFNQITIIMFIAPIFNDVFSVKLPNDKRDFLHKLKIVLIIYNSIITAFCIFICIGVIDDCCDKFILSVYGLLKNGLNIPKTMVGVILIFELLVPLMMFFGCPTVRKQKTIKNFYDKYGE